LCGNSYKSKGWPVDGRVKAGAWTTLSYGAHLNSEKISYRHSVYIMNIYNFIQSMFPLL